QQQATLDQFLDPVNGGPPITLGVVVTVVVNCGDPAPSGFELGVAVRQGDITGDGDEFFSSTGGRQEVQVEAFGPFIPGDASASAALRCGPLLLEGEDLGATIKIS